MRSVRRQSAHPASRAGFTLVEVLVVTVIIGVLAATVMLTFSGGNLEQEIRGEAERMAQRIELARSYALQRNREWGVVVERDRYAFVELDTAAAIWVEQAQRPLAPVELPENMTLELQVEGFEAIEALLASVEDTEEAEDAESVQPHILLFSSGELTPFTARLVPSWEGTPWHIRSDGLSTTRSSQDDDA